MSSSNNDNFDPDMFNFGDESAQPELGDVPLANASNTADPAVDPEAAGPEAMPAPNPPGKEKKAKKEKTPRAKKEKPPKEKKAKPPRDPSTADGSKAVIGVYAACGVGLLLLLAINGYAFVTYGTASIMFSLFLDLFGAAILAVPLLCWTGRKTLNFYEICLGLTVIALAIATTLLLIEISRYGGDLKASQASRGVPARTSPLA